MRWKIIIEYLGTQYCGWQRQKEDIDTVQESIEKAIFNFCQQEITIHAAGRTDAGVHARGQTAHFDLDYGERSINGFELAKALNAHLRYEPIRIIHAEEVDESFHARHSATDKLYTYRIINRAAGVALEKELVWHIRRPLNTDAMNDAAQILTGFHDFSTFRDTQCQAQSPEKTLDKLWIEAKPYDNWGGTEILVHAQARSFLHHQVRNMVGSLSLVGEGKWSKQDLQDALDAKDRAAGGPTAPASGLYLVQVYYDTLHKDKEDKEHKGNKNKDID